MFRNCQSTLLVRSQILQAQVNNVTRDFPQNIGSNLGLCLIADATEAAKVDGSADVKSCGASRLVTSQKLNECSLAAASHCVFASLQGRSNSSSCTSRETPACTHIAKNHTVTLSRRRRCSFCHDAFRLDAGNLKTSVFVNYSLSGSGSPCWCFSHITYWFKTHVACFSKHF